MVYLNKYPVREDEILIRFDPLRIMTDRGLRNFPPKMRPGVYKIVFSGHYFRVVKKEDIDNIDKFRHFCETNFSDGNYNVFLYVPGYTKTGAKPKKVAYVEIMGSKARANVMSGLTRRHFWNRDYHPQEKVLVDG